MAAVAGAMAEHAGRRASEAGDTDVIVENGGDIYILASRPVVVSLFAGASRPASLAFEVTAEETPLAICSSSGVMGHSLSFGNADVVTVVADNAALADAAATALCNSIDSPGDLGRALQAALKIPRVRGALAVIEDAFT